jgi:hypothetical protein
VLPWRLITPFGDYRPLLQIRQYSHVLNLPFMSASDSHQIPQESSLEASSAERMAYSSRKPQRITITVSHFVHEALVVESLAQGRSLSNLASFWLEQQALLARRRGT